jgi:hypothetical protein
MSVLKVGFFSEGLQSLSAFVASRRFFPACPAQIERSRWKLTHTYTTFDDDLTTTLQHTYTRSATCGVAFHLRWLRAFSHSSASSLLLLHHTAATSRCTRSACQFSTGDVRLLKQLSRVPRVCFCIFLSRSEICIYNPPV